MAKTFSNEGQKLKCIFTDKGVSFCSPQQEIFYPYGCIDSVKISILGILQVISHAKVCTFAIHHKDRAEMKNAVHFAQNAMKTADKNEEMRVIDLSEKKGSNAEENLSPEEKLKKYKAMFIQGIISKEEYEARKRQLQ